MAIIAARSQKESSPMVNRKRFGIRALRPTLALAVAAITVTALTVNTPRRSAFALADVQRALYAVKTAHWIETETDYDANGAEITHRESEHWANLTRPEQAMQTLPGRFRNRNQEVRQTVQQTVENPQQTTIWYAAENTFITGPTLFTQYHQHKRRIFYSDEQMRQWALVKIFPNQSMMFPEQATGWNREMAGTKITISPPRSVTWSSRQAVEFRSETHTEANGNQPDQAQHQTFHTALVWADPKTRLVIGSEWREADEETGRVTRILTEEQFRYNEKLPRSVFELMPPDGAILRTKEPNVPIGVWVSEKEWPKQDTRDVSSMLFGW